MRAVLVAPLYLSLSWVLTVSYQLFTDTAVRSITSSIGLFWPSAAGWLAANVETIVFVYAFTWIFVLSSVIPQVILGKERGVLVQYLVVLVLSLIAFFMPQILESLGIITASQLYAVAGVLQNPVLAGFYLLVPYLFMVALDLNQRRVARISKETELFDSYAKLTGQFKFAGKIEESDKEEKNSNK